MLIELVFIVVFLGVALVATMNLLSTGMTDSVKVELMATAVNLANSKLEAIMADKKSRGYGYIKEANYQDETSAEGHSGFNRFVSVTDHGTHKEVRVRVTHAKIPDVELVALLTNY